MMRAVFVLCVATAACGPTTQLVEGGKVGLDDPVERYVDSLRDLVVLFLHLLTTIARLAGPGGARAVVAESVLVKHQLLILNRSRHRAPNLRPADRIVAGVCALLMRSSRLSRAAIVLQPSTLVRFHRALVQRKYRLLFSSTVRKTPGPKGPHPDVIAAVVAMEQRNPTWGCPRIAQQIAVAFGISLDKDVVRRILAARSRPGPGSAGSSWLTILGHAKDRLWSLDLFRCESATLRTHWVLLVMDHWTRRLIGFGVHRGVVDGAAICRMFNHATRGQSLPRYLKCTRCGSTRHTGSVNSPRTRYSDGAIRHCGPFVASRLVC